jgi:hypothetical protein
LVRFLKSCQGNTSGNKHTPLVLPLINRPRRLAREPLEPGIGFAELPHMAVRAGDNVAAIRALRDGVHAAYV